MHISEAVFNAPIIQMRVIIEITVIRNKFNDKALLKALENQANF